MIRFRALAAGLALGLGAWAARCDADAVTLDNGAVLYGDLVTETDQVVVLRPSAGGEISIPRPRVTAIVRTPRAPAAQGPAHPAGSTPTPAPAPGPHAAQASPAPPASPGAGKPALPGEKPLAVKAGSAPAAPPGVAPSADKPAAGPDAEETPAQVAAWLEGLRVRWQGDSVAMASAAVHESPARAGALVDAVARTTDLKRHEALLFLVRSCPHTSVRVACVEALAGEPDHECLVPFLDLLDQTPGAVQTALLARIRRADQPDPIRRIIEVCGRLDEEALPEAGATLRSLALRCGQAPAGARAEVIDPVALLARNLAADLEPKTAAAHLDLLIRVRGPGLVETFARWLQSPDAKCRRLAVRGLGLLPETGATSILTRACMREADPTVQLEYVQALAQRAPLDSLPGLLDLLLSPHEPVRQAAHDLLAKYLNQDCGSDPESWRNAARQAVERLRQ